MGTKAFKYYSKEQVLLALEKTKSLAAAAKELRCSYPTLLGFVKSYTNDEGVPFIDLYKNQSGKNMSKNAKRTMGDNTIRTLDILNGDANISDFTYEQIKNRCYRDKILRPKCRCCGFSEKRADGLTPLVLNFKDGNIKNFHRTNLELLCYNCYFMEGNKIIVNEEHVSGVNTFNPAYDTTANVEYGTDIIYYNDDSDKFRHDIDMDDDMYDIVAK